MTEAWATWTASLPRDSSRSERTAMTSLYSMRSPVSVQLRGPFLFELPQLRLDRLQLHAGAVPDLFVMSPCARGLHPHPPFGVLDRAPQALPFLRELLQLQADAMVPLLFGQQLARPRFREEHEGPDHTRRRGDGAEDIVRQRAAPPARVYLKIVCGARTGGKGLGVGPLHPPPEVPERNGIASRRTCAAWTTSSAAGSRTVSSSS